MIWRERPGAWAAAASGGLLVLTGCGLLPMAGRAAGAREQAAIAAMGCEQAQSFAFAGETSLAALGLDDQLGGGPDTNRIGMIWVTQDAVNFGAPPGAAPDPQRMVCVQWPDGSGMAGPVPPGWQPPSAFDLAAGSGEFEPPLVLIGLVLAAALIAGVSFLAFREKGT